jgi:hypothetical protein
MDEHLTPFRISQAAHGYIQLEPWEVQHLKFCERCYAMMRGLLRILFEIPS